MWQHSMKQQKYQKTTPRSDGDTSFSHVFPASNEGESDFREVYDARNFNTNEKTKNIKQKRTGWNSKAYDKFPADCGC